jgi:hypothetical protein
MLHKRTIIVVAMLGLARPDRSGTLAAVNGRAFDGGFRPYQSTRLSRYDVVY